MFVRDEIHLRNQVVVGGGWGVETLISLEEEERGSILNRATLFYRIV
jgi:hypothetical protein